MASGGPMISACRIICLTCLREYIFRARLAGFVAIAYASFSILACSSSLRVGTGLLEAARGSGVDGRAGKAKGSGSTGGSGLRKTGWGSGGNSGGRSADSRG